MSFKSLVNKLVKEGKSRAAATKIAGKVANAKMKGAGSGPTAKQKARMKKGSPTKMKDLSGDGKVTKKDVLIGRGVLKKDGSPAKKVVDKKKTKTTEYVESEGGAKATNVRRTKEVTKSRRGGKVTVIKSKTKNSLDKGKFQVTNLKQKGRKTKEKEKEVKGRYVKYSESKKDAGQRKQSHSTKFSKDKKGLEGYRGKKVTKTKNYSEHGAYAKGAKTKTKSPANMKRKVTKTKKTVSLGKTAGDMVFKGKTVTKKDGSVKNIRKYKTKGGGKSKTKSRSVEKMESAAGGKTTIKTKVRNKRYSSKAIPKKRVTKIEGTTKYNVGPDKMTEFKTTSRTIKKSPTKMKKQGYNARLDDSLGAKHGKKSQSLKSRRDESEGMEKSMGKRKFSGNKSSAQGSPAKMNGKTLKKTTTKAKDTKGVKTVQPKRSKTLVKNIEKKVVTKKGVKTGSLDAAKAKRSKANAAAARKQGYMMNYNTGQYQATPNKRGAERRKESGLNRFQAYDQMDTRNAAQTAGSPMGMYGKHSPANAYGKSPMNAYGKSPMKMSHGKSPMKMKAKGGCAISKHMGGRR